MRVCVVGAGVIGLSTALNVLQRCRDADVTLIADSFSPDVTSANVAGFWEPYNVGDTPEELYIKWSSSTFKHFMSLIHEGVASSLGVELVSGYMFTPETTCDPPWKDIVFGFRPITQREIREFHPRAKSGAFFTSVIYNGSNYLSWLLGRIKDRGCKIIMKHLGSLEELVDDYDVIVNCTGIGARRLVGDEELVPHQGQLITVKGVSQKLFWIDCCSEPYNTSIFPRSDHVIVGGTVVRGNWSTVPSLKVQEDILVRAERIVPSLKNAQVVKSWVGLRPVRQKGVRLELETMQLGLKKIQVVHNYGHGGAGVTLHWGCAEEVAESVHSCQMKLRQSKL